MKTENKETTFKVDLGNGVEIISWTRMQNLTKEEKDFLASRVTERVASTNEPLGKWDTKNVINLLNQ